jgi:hypothetical protein
MSNNQTQDQRQREQQARDQQQRDRQLQGRSPSMPQPGVLKTPQQRQDELRQREHGQRDTREGQRGERNALAQNTGGAEAGVDRGAINQRIAAEYEGLDQPGKHEANLPGRRLQGDGRDHKANTDLEDITGNPGHLNVNPNAPAGSMNPASLASEAGPESINEPAAVQQAVPPDHLPSINEPPGSQVLPPAVPPEGGGSGEGEGDLAPELLSIDPDVAAIGDAELTLTCTGEDFDETCVIVFNGGEEETTFISATELTTIVQPMTATVAGEFPVTVRNAHGESEPVMFEFVEAARAHVAKSRAKKPPKPSKKKKAGSRR